MNFQMFLFKRNLFYFRKDIKKTKRILLKYSLYFKKIK